MSKKYKVYEYAIIRESAKIGKGTVIGPFCYIGDNVKIGKNCRIFYYTNICQGTKIGDNVTVGPGTRFYDRDYLSSQPPTIEDNVIIHGGCSILPGITIHHDSLIGVASIVNRNIPPQEVWYGFGNPARFITTRKQYEKDLERKRLDQE